MWTTAARRASQGCCAKNEHFAVDFDYAYSDVYTATNICYTNQDSGFLTGNTSPYFAGAASLSSSGALLTCPTSATNSTPTQWLARAFMDAPTQHGRWVWMSEPQRQDEVRPRLPDQLGCRQPVLYRCPRGQRCLNSTYQTPYLNVDYTMHPGLVWKAEYNYYGYGEGGPSGAQNCTLNSVATATAANIVPCASMSVSTGMNSGVPRA